MMSLTFGLFTQVSDSGPLGPLVFIGFKIPLKDHMINRSLHSFYISYADILVINNGNPLKFSGNIQKSNCKTTFFRGYLLSRFCLLGHFRGDLFSRISKTGKIIFAILSCFGP